MAKDRILTKPGYYRRDDRGHLEPHAPATPDVCVSRRVVDFPNGRAPTGACLVRCAECGAWIASDGKHPEQPRICLQCAGLQPLPLEAS